MWKQLEGITQKEEIGIGIIKKFLKKIRTEEIKNVINEMETTKLTQEYVRDEEPMQIAPAEVKLAAKMLGKKSFLNSVGRQSQSSFDTMSPAPDPDEDRMTLTAYR